MSDGGLPRTRVKVCGVTNVEDAECAIALGADALGFNTFPQSSRFIDLRTEGPWIRRLPPFVSRVAVMVNPSIAQAEEVFRLPFIDAVQFHGTEDETFCAHFARLDLPFIKAVAVAPGCPVTDLERFSTRRILLDALVQGAFGGAGRLIDLQAAAETVRAHPALSIVLSGGLSPGNVADAIRVVRPFAVDVASGVERVSRRKDPLLMRQFIDASGSAERRG